MSSRCVTTVKCWITKNKHNSYIVKILVFTYPIMQHVPTIRPSSRHIINSLRTVIMCLMMAVRSKYVAWLSKKLVFTTQQLCKSVFIYWLLNSDNNGMTAPNNRMTISSLTETVCFVLGWGVPHSRIFTVFKNPDVKSEQRGILILSSLLASQNVLNLQSF